MSTKKSKTLKDTAIDKPSPLDFEAFIPWVCLNWQFPVIVTVTKVIQESHKDVKRKSSAKSTKSVKSRVEELTKSTSKVYESQLFPFQNYYNSIPITGYYDNEGKLLEIAIDKSPIHVYKTIIRAFGLCLPFHIFLYKLSIRNGGINSTVLSEISKLLSQSNLTNICLDGSNIHKFKCHILLENTSQLKTLSLNRCHIDDFECKQLADSLDFGKCCLLTLELGSNHISDIGAQALGVMLRGNRHLLHLNLSGNMITDSGASFILNHLMKFKLNVDEIFKKRQSKIKYVQEKLSTDKQCLQDILVAKSISRDKLLCSKRLKMVRKHPSSIEQYSLVAENMAKKIVGEISEPFNSEHVYKQNGHFYCVGNMFLCSLNLAYNNLEYQSLKTIKEVLTYQQQITKPHNATGLLRIVIEGNCIPKYCEDYVDIIQFLDKTIKNYILTVISPPQKKVQISKTN